MTKKVHGDRPVYRNREGKHLYSMECGAWAVSVSLGNSLPVYRNTDPAPSPTLCQNWENRDCNIFGGYKPGGLKVTVKK